jgi:hypothetical protein
MGEARVPETAETTLMGWRVVVRQPVAAMVGQMERQRRELFFHVLTGSMIGLLVLGWGGWHWGGPLERLAGQAERVEDVGDFVALVPASAPTEVRLLGTLVERLARSVHAGRRALAEARQGPGGTGRRAHQRTGKRSTKSCPNNATRRKRPCSEARVSRQREPRDSYATECHRRHHTLVAS